MTKRIEIPSPATCIDCWRWRVQVATPDYSEMTPGNQFDMSCEAGHWTLNQYRDGEDELRAFLEKAMTCPDFAGRMK